MSLVETTKERGTFLPSVRWIDWPRTASLSRALEVTRQTYKQRQRERETPSTLLVQRSAVMISESHCVLSDCCVSGFHQWGRGHRRLPGDGKDWRSRYMYTQRSKGHLH